MSKTSTSKSKHRYNLRLQNQFLSETDSELLPSQSKLLLPSIIKTLKNLKDSSPGCNLQSKHCQSSKKSVVSELQHSSKKGSISKHKLVKKVRQDNVPKSSKNLSSSSKRLTVRNKSANKFQSSCFSFSESTPSNDLLLKHKYSKKRKIKSDGFKKSHKTTLKRKKSAIEAIIKADENYEDDLYESKKFDQFKELLMDSPNSERSFSISTPEFPVTPVMRNITPKFKDCFSLEEYEMSRKAAMEYIYRSGKQRSCQKPTETLVGAVKKKLEFNEAIEIAEKFQTSIQSVASKDSDDDNF